MLNVRIIWTIDELLQLSKPVSLGQGKDQLRLDVGLSGFLASHLQKLHKVLPVSCNKHFPISFTHAADRSHSSRLKTLFSDHLTTLCCCLSHLHVSRRVIRLDVGVDGFFYQALLELSLSQLTPHWRLIAALCELVSSVQVPDVFNQNLERTSNFKTQNQQQ